MDSIGRIVHRLYLGIHEARQTRGLALPIVLLLHSSNFVIWSRVQIWLVVYRPK